MDQDETWHSCRPRPWPHCVRWGPSSPPPKGGTASQFSAHICCGQMAGWIKMPLGMQVGLSQGHIVLDGDPAPLPQRAQPPILAHICCGQMAGWIKMPLGMEVGLSQGHIVPDGDPAPLPHWGTAPNFWPIYGVAKWLDGSRCHLVQQHCVRLGPSSPCLKGTRPPVFGPCLLWPRSPILATSEFLSNHYAGQPLLAGTPS